MSIPDDHIEAILASILAVNAYGLEKAYGLLPAFRAAGLTNPTIVVRQNAGDLMMGLAHAGYDRGLLTEMMAGRLANLMSAVVDGRLDELGKLVANSDRNSAISLLCSVKGIGPKVASDAWMLMRTKPGARNFVTGN